MFPQREECLNVFYAGLDWADDHHDLVVIDEASTKLAAKRFAHTKAGLEELTRFLESFTGPEHKDQLACIIETSRGLLISTLLEAGFTVYPVNPKVADRRRSASGAKTDQIDAYLLAKLGRAELADLRKLHPDSPSIAELKELTRDQDALVQMQTRLVNQLTACLKAYYPVALELFTKLHQRSTLRFLQTFPTPQAAMAASAAQIAQVLKEAGHPTASKVASQIYDTLHRPHLTADAITTRTKSRLALALIAQLLPLLEQIAAYEKEIETLFLTHADSQIFESLPGAGKRLAPRLLAELGDDRTRDNTRIRTKMGHLTGRRGIHRFVMLRLSLRCLPLPLPGPFLDQKPPDMSVVWESASDPYGRGQNGLGAGSYKDCGQPPLQGQCGVLR